MANYPIEISPRGSAAFVHVYEPDTKYGEAYKITLNIPKDDPSLRAGLKGGKEWITVEEWIAHHEKLVDECGGSNPCKIKDGDTLVNSKGEKKDYAEGCWTVEFKSKYKPTIVDTKKQELHEADVKIQPGDIIKVVLKPRYYESGANSGITLYVNKVMLIDSSGGVDFGEEEGGGFVADRVASDDARETAPAAAEHEHF